MSAIRRPLAGPARPLLVWLVLVGACSSCAAASRVSDDSDAVEPGDCEIETTFERRRARGAAAERESAVQIACGIGWKTELTATFASRANGAERDRGFGLEGKTSLNESTAGNVGWALVYGVGTERSRAGPWQPADFFLALEGTWRPASAWRVEARVGTARDRLARSDSTTWTLAAERTLGESFEARAELIGDDRSRPWTGVTLRWRIWPEHAVLSLSGGVRAGPLRERRAGLGLTFEF